MVRRWEDLQKELDEGPDGYCFLFYIMPDIKVRLLASPLLTDLPNHSFGSCQYGINEGGPAVLSIELDIKAEGEQQEQTLEQSPYSLIGATAGKHNFVFEFERGPDFSYTFYELLKAVLQDADNKVGVR